MREELLVSMRIGAIMKQMLSLLICVFLIDAALAEEQPHTDNGTDPTKLTQTLTAAYEYLDLRNGFFRGTFKPSYRIPLGAHTSVTLQVPFVRTDLAGDDGFDLGDASAKFSHVYKLTRQYGIVLTGEVVFDTAARPELGGGATVFKGTVIYAKFLRTGAIFAPALGLNDSIGHDGRPTRSVVADFYYVPKLSDRRYFITVDPALTGDLENDAEFASLAITFGRLLGPGFGGTAQLYAKPSVFAGSERSADWGIEIGYKLVGF
jgi:hypothetical protein